MSLYENLLRPLLFRLPPDRAHALAQTALRWPVLWKHIATRTTDDARLKTCFAGVALPNPIGLAAGFDKNGDLLESLSMLGFGAITIGSIMPEPRAGNPYPRLVRYADRESQADSMGLPSRGADYVVARLRQFHPRRSVPIFANVGGFTAESIAATVMKVEPYVNAVEISLMCPNVVTKPDEFDEMQLLRDVMRRLDGRRKPAIVRVPNATAAAHDRLDELIEICVREGVCGIKVGGGRPVVEQRLGSGQGTLHGRAIFDTALANVKVAARTARGRLDIKGNGGIFEAAEVAAMLDAGAACVDLYTAFIYRGWTIATALNRDLLQTALVGEAALAS